MPGCPPRRSGPAISRFCPALGWLNLVKSVTHRAVVSVALAVPIVLNVPDMWNRLEDNLLEQTIANMIPLDAYHPTDSFWNQVAKEIPGHLPRQYQERYMSDASLALLTWAFLSISVGRVSCTPVTSLLCVSNDSRDSSCKTTPSSSQCYSLTHAHRPIGYRIPPSM